VVIPRIHYRFFPFTKEDKTGFLESVKRALGVGNKELALSVKIIC